MRQQCTTSDAPVLFGSPTENDSAATPSDPAERLTSGGLARAIIRARSARRQFFDSHLFADPPWDMLLELYALSCEGLRVSVSKLSVAAGVPGTTALRWIDKLEAEGLILRTADPLDGRRIWVELSELGVARMRRYLEQVSVRQAAAQATRPGH